MRLYGRPLGDGEISALAKDVDSSLVGVSFDSQPSELLMNYKFSGSYNSASPVGNTLSSFGTVSYATGKEGIANTSVRFTGAGRQFMRLPSYAGLYLESEYRFKFLKIALNCRESFQSKQWLVYFGLE